MYEIDRKSARQLDSQSWIQRKLDRKKGRDQKWIYVRGPPDVKRHIRTLHRRASSLHGTFSVQKREASLLDVGTSGII